MRSSGDNHRVSLTELRSTGRNNGKKILAVRIVKHALEIINLTTDQNPLQVVVDAIMNSGAREDSTRIGSGGVVRRQVRLARGRPTILICRLPVLLAFGRCRRVLR